MRWHRQVRVDDDGINGVAEVDAVLAVNRGRPGAATSASAERLVAVVQGSSRKPAAGEQPHSDSTERT